MNAHTKETQDQMTPVLSLEVLKKGNERFRANLESAKRFDAAGGGN